MPTIIHHSDADGLLSAAILCMYAGSESTFYKVDYGNMEIPWEEITEPLTILDFSFPEKEMLRLYKEFPSLVWIDHHKTAMEMRDANAVIPGVRKNGVATCQLCWDMFSGSEWPPIVKLIGDNDIGKKYDDALAATLWLTSRSWWTDPKAPEYRTFFQRSLWRQLQLGRELLEAEKEKVKEAVEHGWPTKIDDFSAFVVNGRSPILATAIFEKGPEIAITYLDGNSPTGVLRTISLYSKSDGPDVSVICKARGGGGHEHASGYQVQIEKPI